MDIDAITYVESLINKMNKEPQRLDNFHNSLLVSTNPDIHIFKIPIDDIFTKYKNQLFLTITTATISEEEFYKPKLVSERIYGTTELWLALLRLNMMRDVTEFCSPQILIYSPNIFNDLFDLIMQREGKQ